MSVELRSWWYEDEHNPDDDPLSYYAGWQLELIVDDRVYALSRDSIRPREVIFDGLLPIPRAQNAPPRERESPGVQRLVGGVPYGDPIFVKAARWLLDQPGIERLRVWVDDVPYPDTPFVPVDPDRLP